MKVEDLVAKISELDPETVKHATEMADFLAIAYGLSLESSSNPSIIDFQRASDSLGKALNILKLSFGEQAASQFRKKIQDDAPSFLKNLVFYGGPLVKHNIVAIRSMSQLKANVSGFNQEMAHLKISVKEEDVLDRCCEQLLAEGSQSKHWLKQYCKSTNE